VNNRNAVLSTAVAPALQPPRDQLGITSPCWSKIFVTVIAKSDAALVDPAHELPMPPLAKVSRNAGQRKRRDNPENDHQPAMRPALFIGGNSYIYDL
jgi:hypothetical protein